ncbi:alpha-L-rhamnosidase-related protein [Parapedobacter soli]|uniref:alpha-L-rhamnosidase-related protein n=1 Tax=Parapedobacter soli TaxID=416955 RepID=UPI0021C8AFA5|nr:twin-arginine translocation signal domain-containing protein [Parapedobacter soli]
MITRRNFIQQSAMAGIAIGLPNSLAAFTKDDTFVFQSRYFKIQLRKDYPIFNFFSTDSLGEGMLSVNTILETDSPEDNVYEARIERDNIAYFSKTKRSDIPLWKCSVSPRSFSLQTHWNENNEYALPFTITFAQKINHCTVLGVMEEKNVMKFPCVLHFPGMGSFRVYCDDPSVTLSYDADRNTGNPFVKLSFPAADERHKKLTYFFESVAIYPELDYISDDKRFDGFRRNFINIFQMNPRIYSLANNSASDACTFTLYLYAEMAQYTPELAKGLSAMDLVRNTLDRYFGGMKGYGEVGYINPAGGWQSEYDSCDTAPSVIMAACNYVLHTKDLDWGRANYKHIRGWAAKMIATDRNKDGIIEYGLSGNSGSWDGVKRPANWWDTIGFGHDDAYSNALAYRSCLLLAKLAQLLEKTADDQYFRAFAANLKANYFNNFYNAETGVLAGWRSEDGRLHDYYFVFVNSVAISYGLIEEKKAAAIMRRILDKMKTVGFTDFRLGLPGNLLPIPKEDYTDIEERYGYGAFQVYENGGATGCYAYFTVHALYKLGMNREAEMILMPMLESYKNGDFQGHCPGSDKTKDWKSWNGECWGYEGFLVDNFLTLLAVFDGKIIDENV